MTVRYSEWCSSSSDCKILRHQNQLFQQLLRVKHPGFQSTFVVMKKVEKPAGTVTTGNCKQEEFKKIDSIVHCHFNIKPTAALTAVQSGIPPLHKRLWRGMTTQEFYTLYLAIQKWNIDVLNCGIMYKGNIKA